MSTIVAVIFFQLIVFKEIHSFPQQNQSQYELETPTDADKVQHESAAPKLQFDLQTLKDFKLSLDTDKTRESVNLEQNKFPVNIVDTFQKYSADAKQVEPILDTIQEYEKYGNDGDFLGGLSRSIVNGYEAFSNILNFFIQQPKTVARSISKTITNQLDQLGGKLVGL